MKDKNNITEQERPHLDYLPTVEFRIYEIITCSKTQNPIKTMEGHQK